MDLQIERNDEEKQPLPHSVSELYKPNSWDSYIKLTYIRLKIFLFVSLAQTF